MNNQHIGPYFSIMARSEYVYISRHINSKYNFGRTQFFILRKLSLTNYPLNQEFFAKYFKINKGSIARTFKKLEENGYIQRKKDSKNKRQYNITLTIEGEKVANEIRRLESEWEDKMCEKYNRTRDDLLENLKNMTMTSLELIEEYNKN